MPITTRCECGRTICLHDELAGKRIRCPNCRSVCLVPLPTRSTHLNDEPIRHEREDNGHSSRERRQKKGRPRRVESNATQSTDEWEYDLRPELSLPPRRRSPRGKGHGVGDASSRGKLFVGALIGFVAIALVAVCIRSFFNQPSLGLGSLFQTSPRESDVPNSSNQAIATGKTSLDTTDVPSDPSHQIIKIGNCTIAIDPTIMMQESDRISDPDMEWDRAYMTFEPGSEKFELKIFVVKIQQGAPSLDPVTLARRAREVFETLRPAPSEYLEPESTVDIAGKSFSRFVSSQQRNGRTRRTVEYICREGLNVYQLQYSTYVSDSADISVAAKPLEAAIQTFRIN
jgi:hypothetical protein